MRASHSLTIRLGWLNGSRSLAFISRLPGHRDNQIRAATITTNRLRWVNATLDNAAANDRHEIGTLELLNRKCKSNRLVSDKTI
jgi:hypothetical protein